MHRRGVEPRVAVMLSTKYIMSAGEPHTTVLSISIDIDGCKLQCKERRRKKIMHRWGVEPRLAVIFILSTRTMSAVCRTPRCFLPAFISRDGCEFFFTGLLSEPGVATQI
jgi:hypothetical protein